MTTPSRSPLWLVALVAFWTILTTASPVQAAGAFPSPGDYTVDPASSTVGFDVTEFLVNTVSGKFTTFRGKVTVGDSLASSRIEASADVASIDAGIHARNEKLQTADYFDAARFPQMTFASTAIWGTPDNFGIKGNLTIKGVTREVVFSARIEDSGVIHAETKIDRTQFGITAGGTIKNEVKLHLHIKLARVAQP